MDQFEMALANTIASGNLPADICEALKINNHLRIIRPEWLRHWIFLISSRVLAWLSHFNRVDLLTSSTINKMSTTGTSSMLKQLRAGQIRRKPQKLWPLFVLAVYIFEAILLTTRFYFQYIYDANTARLLKLEEFQLRSVQPINRLQITEQLKLEFRQRIDGARATLKLLGAPHIEWPFIMEMNGLVLLQTINWLLVLPLRASHRHWVLLAPKAIIESSNETQVRVNMTLDELRRLEMDSVLLVKAKLERLHRDLMISFDVRDCAAILEFKKLAEQMNRERESLTSKLKVLALGGRLNPLNRTSACRDKLALASLLIGACYYFYTHLVLALAYLELVSYFGDRGRHLQFDSWTDYLSTINLVILVEICIMSALFLAKVYAITLFDQLQETARTRSLVLSVIRNNGLKFQAMLRMDSSSSRRNPTHGSTDVRCPSHTGHHRLLTSKARRTVCRQCAKATAEAAGRQRQRNRARCAQMAQTIELDLMLVLIRYRIHLRTIKLMKEPVQQMVAIVFIFCLVFPIVTGLHGSYLSVELRRVILNSAVAAALCSLCLLMPLASVHRRSTRLFDCLWTLVGQLSYFEVAPQVGEHLRLNSSVALCQLRRHLSDPNLTSKQLSFEALSVPISYMNIIRLFTYTIILTTAGVLAVRLLSDGFEDISSDPLRLFKFLQFFNRTN